MARARVGVVVAAEREGWVASSRHAYALLMGREQVAAAAGRHLQYTLGGESGLLRGHPPNRAGVLLILCAVICAFGDLNFAMCTAACMEPHLNTPISLS